MREITEQSQALGSPSAPISRRRPADITILSLFFLLCAFLCALAAIGLLFPTVGLRPLTKLIQALHEGAGDPFWLCLVCIGCAVAGAGLWRCANWGLVTATFILSFVVIADFLRALFMQRWPEVLITLMLGALIFLYLRARAHCFKA